MPQSQITARLHLALFCLIHLSNLIFQNSTLCVNLSRLAPLCITYTFTICTVISLCKLCSFGLIGSNVHSWREIPASIHLFRCVLLISAIYSLYCGAIRFDTLNASQMWMEWQVAVRLPIVYLHRFSRLGSFFPR